MGAGAPRAGKGGPGNARFGVLGETWISDPEGTTTLPGGKSVASDTNVGFSDKGFKPRLGDRDRP